MIIAQQIRSQIYRAFNLLGADHKLLGTIGSWGTLDDKEILRLLKEWNTDQEMRAAVEALQRNRPQSDSRPFLEPQKKSRAATRI